VSSVSNGLYFLPLLQTKFTDHVPTSEVGYTSVTTGRGDHKAYVFGGERKKEEMKKERRKGKKKGRKKVINKRKKKKKGRERERERAYYVPHPSTSAPTTVF
jgi:hypothetical protein